MVGFVTRVEPVDGGIAITPIFSVKRRSNIYLFSNGVSVIL